MNNTVIALHGTQYEVEIMDTTHCRLREVGSERWGTAYHIAQLYPDTETQLFDAGRIVNRHFAMGGK